MSEQDFLEQYSNESILGARDLMARERRTRRDNTLEVGGLPTWLIGALAVVLIGFVLLAL